MVEQKPKKSNRSGRRHGHKSRHNKNKLTDKNCKTGPTGPTGPAGPMGPRGIKGHMGIDGKDGPTGPTGPSGFLQTITEGNTGSIVLNVPGTNNYYYSNILKLSDNDLVVNGDIIPSVANKYTLGSAAKPFADAYLGANSLFLGETRISGETGTLYTEKAQFNSLTFPDASGNKVTNAGYTGPMLVLPRFNGVTGSTGTTGAILYDYADGLVKYFDSIAWRVIGADPFAFTLYVDPDGSNAGNGSVTAPFKTIQGAHDWAVTRIRSTSYVTIIVNTGFYTENVIITRSFTTICGSTTGTTSSTIITGSITITINNPSIPTNNPENNVIGLSNLTVRNAGTTSDPTSLILLNSPTVHTLNIEFCTFVLSGTTSMTRVFYENTPAANINMSININDTIMWGSADIASGTIEFTNTVFANINNLNVVGSRVGCIVISNSIVNINNSTLIIKQTTDAEGSSQCIDVKTSRGTGQFDPNGVLTAIGTVVPNVAPTLLIRNSYLGNLNDSQLINVAVSITIVVFNNIFISYGAAGAGLAIRAVAAQGGNLSPRSIVLHSGNRAPGTNGNAWATVITVGTPDALTNIA